ncbi:CTD kinase subunit gamma CTK3-domain-containing protein [Podospora fimiseda]|uniref:CTD kinase subunit gamma CTK3-domain-containing protein n=1 Tax=Podospora fimiseda TaxID=252190 RepID=A0AAN7BWU6_9PEZI|nr:CTD kinase subunit gamma CTK3-domain-containing protein [Podospora fimiseda]
MADPFDIRMRFTSLLRQLNASVTSSTKTAQYALKHKDFSDDLHSCILEQLEKSNMNSRANIMYFIEHFLDLAKREGYHEYMKMMQRDIIRVVDAVAPEDGSGAANVKVLKKFLHALQNKTFLDAEAVSQIEEVLRERDTATHDALMSSPPNGEADDESIGTHMAMSRTMAPALAHRKSFVAPNLEKKQIEQRIEEDRERHKRERENIWAIPQQENAEMDKLWEETSSLGEDDERMGMEEYQEWRSQVEAKCNHQQEAKGANGKHP